MRLDVIVLAAALVAALVAFVLSELGRRKRKQARAILEDRVDDYTADAGSDRFVDIGVTLHCVIADPNGTEVIEGKPLMRILPGSKTYGGILDKRRGVIAGRSRNPTVWYCSEDQKAVILHDDEESLGQLVYGSEGCITGDAYIKYVIRDADGNRRNLKGGTLENLHRRFHNVAGGGRGKRGRTPGSEYYVQSMSDSGRIIPNRILDVVDSGDKECIRITTLGGDTITCTPCHPFATPTGYTPAGQLQLGDSVLMHKNTRLKVADQSRIIRPQVYVKHHPFAKTKNVRCNGITYVYHRIARARAVYEATLNGLTLKAYIARLNAGETDGLEYIAPGINIHHLDENPLNDDPANLMAIDHAEHARQHAHENIDNLSYHAAPDVIASIESVGIRRTYDIKLELPPHNFVAQKFIVHNSGKSTALAMWMYFRWLEMLGEDREIGCAAPTEKRLKMVFDELVKLWPRTWWKYGVALKLLRLADGTRIQFVSTTQTSAKGGSPVQGYNWSAAAQDELQDQCGVFDDIGSRGRAAAHGRYKQIGSCTAKEDPTFRSLRDRILKATDPNGMPLWIKRTMLIVNSPFIAKSFIEAKRAVWTEREFRRRFGAEDLPPESRVYFCWDRELSLRPIPLGARKVTSIVLRAKTGDARHALLAGHDPGTAKSATVFLDAFQIRGQADPVWFVRGEIYGQHQTTEQSALSIVAGARKLGANHRADAEQVHVRAQPVGQSEDKPDLDLYRVFTKLGLHVKAAQHRNDGKATGMIKKDVRIDMINRLLCDANGTRRLFVECDDRRQPVAPKLVESLEMAERDSEGRAETDAKNVNDTSDMPSALGYALWPFEKVTASAMRADVKKAIG